MTEARILVVEDEVIVAKDIQERLNSLGHSVAGTASSGEEAIAKIEETQPELILMDIKIKGPMNGIATAEKIRKGFNIPVVYLTAYADEDTVRRAKVTKPFGYLVKPFDDRELHSTIEIALYNHRMEQKLIESEKKYHTLARVSPVGIFHTDAKGYFVYVNQRWCEIAGLSPQEARGEGWRRGLHPDDRQPISTQWHQAAKGNIPFKAEYRFQQRDGTTTWVLGQAMAEQGDPGEVIP